MLIISPDIQKKEPSLNDVKSRITTQRRTAEHHTAEAHAEHRQEKSIDQRDTAQHIKITIHLTRLGQAGRPQTLKFSTWRPNPSKPVRASLNLLLVIELKTKPNLTNQSQFYCNSRAD